MRALTERYPTPPAALAALALAPGEVIEIVADAPRWIVRLATGEFVSAHHRSPTLAGLLDALPATDHPILLAEARCADRFDRAGVLSATNPGEAFELARDALVELDDLAPYAVGHGACPRVDGVDLDGVARLIRAGETAWALRLARDGVARLARALDRSPPPAWSRPRAVLDGWFGTDPAQIAAARAALASDGTVGPVTRAEHFDPRTGAPVPGGLHCARLFGCVSQRGCACGGVRDASGPCVHCGVIVGTLPARDAAFAHLDLEVAVLHPGLVERIAALTDRPIDAVQALLRGEGDRDDFAALLLGLPEGDLTLINWIPIVPPGDRPLTLAPGDAGGLATFVHPIDQAALALCGRAERVRRLVELNAPQVILENERLQLQARVTAYFEAIRAPAPRVGLPPARAIPVVPLEQVDWREPPAAPAISALVWTGPDRLVAQIGAALYRLEPSTGAFDPLWAADHRLPRFFHAGRLGCIGDDPLVDYEGVLVDAAPRALDTGVWHTTWPVDMPCAIVEKDRPEDGLLVLPTHDFVEAAWAAADRPVAVAWTGDGRALWVGDGGADGGLVFADSAVRRRLPLGAGATRALLLDGTVVDAGPAADGDATGPAAIHVGHACVLLEPSGVFQAEGRGRWRLGFDWTAAALSPDASRLALGLASGEVLIVDPAGPAMVGRLAAG